MSGNDDDDKVNDEAGGLGAGELGAGGLGAGELGADDDKVNDEAGSDASGPSRGKVLRNSAWTDREKMTLATVIAAGPCYPGWAKADKKARAKIVWTEYNKSSKGEVDPNVRKGTTPEILAKQYAKMQKQYQTATSTHSKSGGANLLDGRGQLTTQMYWHLRDSRHHRRLRVYLGAGWKCS